MNHFPNKINNLLSTKFHEIDTSIGIVKTEFPLSSGDESLKHSSKQPKSDFFRNQIFRRFHQIVGGNLKVVDQLGSMQSVGSNDPTDDLPATVVVGDQKFYKRVMIGGTIGSAESYANSEWVSNDLTSLIRIMIRNLDQFSRIEKTWGWLKNSWNFVQHMMRRNTISGSQKNIHEHYDLGNDFYQLFLDPTMNYSSGIFESPDADADDANKMHEASIRKMDQVCRKLRLNSLDHVLEIGTGWGGLAVHMAKTSGCRVTTTTISKEQHRFAVERVRKEGLEDRVTVLLQDYRLLTGKFDKIVSIEMIEAVGHQFYDEYFSRCSDLLRDDGVMLLQSITIGEQNYKYHIRHVDFIRKYIFPGGCLPSVTALSNAVGRSTDMRMLSQEDITPHYVKTLAYWRREFMNRIDEVRALGYDEPFVRFWHFYLCYCEAAFAERRVHNIHIMYCKPKCKIDPVNDFGQPLRASISEDADTAECSIAPQPFISGKLSL